MSGVLVDTHVLIWMMTAPERLSVRARQAITAADAIHVSVVSLYEIEAKRRRNSLRGMIDETDRLPTPILDALREAGFAIIPLDDEQAVAAGRLSIVHGDPWDRILIAQARSLNIPLISADTILRAQAADTPVIW